MRIETRQSPAICQGHCTTVKGAVYFYISCLYFQINLLKTVLHDVWLLGVFHMCIRSERDSGSRLEFICTRTMGIWVIHPSETPERSSFPFECPLPSVCVTYYRTVFGSTISGNRTLITQGGGIITLVVILVPGSPLQALLCTLKLYRYTIGDLLWTIKL